MKTTILLLCLVACSVAALAPAEAQEWAVERLEASPRHHEWVEVPAGEGRTVRSFVAYPEESGKTPAVIVIHENRGLTDWVRLFADRVAAAGYLAIAPDLLSGFDAERAHTGAFESSDAAREAIYALDADRVTADLLAVQKHVAALPAASGETVVAGFCWGGSQSFRLATNAPDLAAALVFYGTGPEDEERIAAIAAPVYGFYGENDERVNATIPESKRLMEAHGKTYEVEVYPGAGHAFMRQADDPEGSPEARKAAEAAWERIERILSGVD
jgi:carboxymethylenebutenolidase